MNYFIYLINTISPHILDACSAGLSIITTYFGVMNNPITWPLGLITAFVSFKLYYEKNMIAHLSKELIQIFIMFYGWKTWTQKFSNTEKTKRIEEIDYNLFFTLFFSLFILGVCVGYFLDTQFNSTSPYKDAITTILGIFGLALTSRRILQCWLVWLIYDIISFSMFISNGLFFNALKCCLYIGFASFGFWNWNRKMKQESELDAIEST